MKKTAVIFQYSFRNIQKTPNERPRVDDVLNILESTAALISKDPKIEADWKSFHSLIKFSAEFKVDERTQCSRDLFQELTELTLKAKSGQMVTGGTKLNDQKDTNLCAYFSTMSALRHQLRKTLRSEKSGKDNSKQSDWDQHEYAGLEINEYLDRRDTYEKRFERDLAVMIGCVCPRALTAWFKIRQSFHLLLIYNILASIINFEA